ncbi:exodeoxyribonuclease VII small subunit [Salinisphaera sp. Q1T1-3]|uniref:exodeoxyribonuclease VII small subunit n=1 Tax=Salinisphaera sp. Q1T1-3 TaxID=2321229 RepID=UPI000E74A9F5|nr:exodeoxyribonuclease VII small subunit [Salinisphaera sp. Q1T1-3]RJS95011.1 exodeoxyribonuclease VII small subunit [Salinisphaera sp. Q1T1-3]
MTDQDTDAVSAAPNDEDAPPLAAFESSVDELESLVESLETGEISLEDALAQFERGVTLARQCQAMLKSAELRVDQLISQNDTDTLAPFDAEQPAADE